MKKFFSLFLCIAFTIIFQNTAYAAEDSYTAITEVFPDGSYIESCIEEDSLTIVPFSTSTKSGTKTDSYKHSDGSILWSITVHGKFTYDGSTSRCVVSSISTTCPSSYWKLSNKSASKTDATAKASATAKRYLENKVVQTINRSVQLTCNKNGKLS